MSALTVSNIIKLKRLEISLSVPESNYILYYIIEQTGV